VVAPTFTIPAKPQSDLGNLPGAGPGLIWMLQQCGIHSLEDLARTEASYLAPKLGLVGQILNVGSWLDYARHCQSQR
jgi:predicted RecB family nuclease